MTKNEFCEKMTALLPSLRKEQKLNQDAISEICGVSKKTFIQYEKGRMTISFASAVSLCALLFDSKVLQSAFGNPVSDLPCDLVRTVTFYAPRKVEIYKGYTDVSHKIGYRIQVSDVTGHYRILDKSNMRIASSSALEPLEAELERLNNERIRAEHGWLL